jgi:transcriptional regulator with XRE-family HTH domain
MLKTQSKKCHAEHMQIYIRKRIQFMNDTNLGGRISDLLQKHGLTQRELAEKVGVTEVSMSRYISGDRTPKGPIIANIALALHTTSDYLLGQEADEDSELEYYRTQRAIARNAKKWTQKQKADLVNALFESEN